MTFKKLFVILKNKGVMVKLKYINFFIPLHPIIKSTHLSVPFNFIGFRRSL